MAVKVIIKRIFRDGALREAHKMLIQARQNAMQEEGYISSETLSNCDNPNEIIVLSMWHSRKDWDRYEFSPARRELESRMSEMIEGKTETTAYEMGAR